MIENTSLDPSAASDLAKMLAEMSVESPVSTPVVQSPETNSGEFLRDSRFLSILDTVTHGGFS